MNELIRRSYGMAVRAFQEDDRTVDVVASTDAIDAYGEVLVQDWDLDRYKANPVVLFGHSSWDMPIGFASDVRVEKGQLLAKLHFVDEKATPLAERVWQGIRQGSLRAVSVGFRSKQAVSREIDDKLVYVLSGNELVEISVVPIPANPEAVAVGAKSMDLIRALAGEGTNGVKKVMSFLKSLLPILALADTSTEVEAIAEVNRLKTFERELLVGTGKKSLTEALGTVDAWKGLADANAKLNAEIVTLKSAGDDRERDALIVQGRKDKKLSPAQAEKLKSKPLDYVKSFIEDSAVNPVLGAKVEEEPDHKPTVLTHNGKKWSELTPMEKHNLHFDNKDLYVAMRDAEEAAA